MLGLALTGLPGSTALADAFVDSAYQDSHQVGARLGGWSNQGSLPADSFDLDPGGYYLTDIADGSFYLEGFYGHRFSPLLAAEISFGLVSRGDVILVEADGGSSIGTVQIYPILVKLRLYPLGRSASNLHPYLLAGGGLYYGRHDIQIASGYDAYFRQAFGEDSRTAFSYVLGAGFDWPVASAVALELQAQYLPIDFSGQLIGVDDYSAFTITVGVKYLLSRNKYKNDDHNSRSRRGR